MQHPKNNFIDSLFICRNFWQDWTVMGLEACRLYLKSSHVKLKVNVWGTRTRQAWEVWLWKNSTWCYWEQKFMSIQNTSSLLHGGILIHICWSKSGTTHEHAVHTQTWISNIGLAGNVWMSPPRKHTARDGNIPSLFLYHLNINIQLLHTMQLQPFYCRRTLGKSSSHCYSSQQCMIKPTL